MPGLDEPLALELVERGWRLAPLDRAVLLVAALDGIEWSAAADLPLDRRDARLIEARIAAFGPKVSCFARCPSCGEAHEADFDLRELPPPTEGEANAVVAGHTVRLRPPTSRVVAEAARSDQPLALLEACVEGVPDPDADFAEHVEAALASCFPLLDIRLELVCSACSAGFDIRFDIVSWLWGEIESVATRAVDAVDRLARAYGWSEQAILGLSPARRELYLAKVAT